MLQNDPSKGEEILSFSALLFKFFHCNNSKDNDISDNLESSIRHTWSTREFLNRCDSPCHYATCRPWEDFPWWGLLTHPGVCTRSVFERSHPWHFTHSACQPGRAVGAGPAVTNANDLLELFSIVISNISVFLNSAYCTKCVVMQISTMM